MVYNRIRFKQQLNYQEISEQRLKIALRTPTQAVMVTSGKRGDEQVATGLEKASKEQPWVLLK